VTDVTRPLRGTLPFITALTVATTAFLLPAGALAATPGRASQWWLPAIGVPQAWKNAPAKGKGVTVAVLSTGVDATHPDLAGNVVTGPDFSRSGRSPGGPFWGYEGTAVASLIAGHGHGPGGAAGITGVAPDATILSVRVTLEYNDPLNSSGSAVARLLPGAIADGIRYAVSHGATVIALPLDPGTLGPPATGDPAAAGGSPAERAAVSYALSRDVVLVAPAGDNGAGTRTVNYPAAYPGVIAVGATGRGGRLTSFTSTRSYVALTAPGSGLTEADPDGYASIATSDMSAALTAGVAALIRSRFPLLTAAEVTRALETGTVPGGHAPGDGRGALNAARALAAAAQYAASPSRQARAASRPAPGTVTTRPAGLGALAGSVLRDAVIAAGVLILALACVLLGTAARRRRPAGQPTARTGQGRAVGHVRNSSHGSHARRAHAATGNGPPEALPATRGSARPGGHAGGPAAAGGRPRVVPLTKSGSLGPPSRAQRKKTEDKPPWGPAAAPDFPSPSRFLGPDRPASDAHSPCAKAQELPPWEQPADAYAAAPIPADLPDWTVSNVGPMYVWNPGATTTPFPAIGEPESPTDVPGTQEPIGPGHPLASEPEPDPGVPPVLP
jgi:hypothetical protein